MGRNSFRGEGTWSLSARLSKWVSLGGGRRLTGMLEAYNLTNRVNFTGYNANVGTTGLVADLRAIVPNAAQTMRQVQIGARFEF